MGLVPIGYPYIKYIMGRLARSRGDRIEKKKMGRPTDNPKSKPIHVRLDAECEQILEEYCKQEKVSRAEGVRAGIKKLEHDIKK